MRKRVLFLPILLAGIAALPVLAPESGWSGACKVSLSGESTLPEFAVAEARPAADGPVPRPTVVPLKMTLMGKTHGLTGQVSDWSYSEKTVSFTVSFPVSLKDCGTKPPSVLGLLKVKDEILVKASLALKRK